MKLTTRELEFLNYLRKCTVTPPEEELISTFFSNYSYGKRVFSRLKLVGLINIVGLNVKLTGKGLSAINHISNEYNILPTPEES
jgi:hypothetical protein